jgi:hypothetical protein
MGFFNAMSSIGDVNRLLKDLENQVRISQDQVERGAPLVNLQNSLNVHKQIHQSLINVFSNSSGARTAVYTIFGDKMRMDDVLTYSKNVTMNLAAIISNR